jgi:hypothetical protein
MRQRLEAAFNWVNSFCASTFFFFGEKKEAATR